MNNQIFIHRKEAEAQRQAEAEEQARRAEQRRREAEALRKLQERSKAPWAQAPRAPVPAAQASLAEIQRLEREKKAVSELVNLFLSRDTRVCAHLSLSAKNLRTS